MQVAMRKMGNSHGILIPKPILNQLGLLGLGAMGKVDLQVKGDVIEIRAIQPSVRAGWAQDSARLAAAGDDALRWAEFGNQGDSELVW